MNDTMSGKRAARLLRVSTRGQDEDNQDRPTAEYIVTRGMTPATTYRLHGASASKGQQVKAVREAVAAARRGEFDVLVIRAIDRLDRRGTRYGWQLLGELMDAGVTVLSVADPALERIGTDPMAEVEVSFKLAIAKQEVDDKRRRIADTFRRMDDAGSFRGIAPAGYAVEGDKYGKRLVPAAAPYAVGTTRVRTVPSAEQVKQAFADAPFTSTVKLGARLGMTPDAVAKLLRAKVYSTGIHTVKRADGVTAIHRCEALVTPAVQARAVAALEARRTGDNQTSRALAKDDFSGALRCAYGDCGGTLYRYYAGGGSRGGKVRRYACDKCHRSVKADNADAAVNAFMSARQEWHLESVWVDGDDNTAELDRVALELRELPGRGLDDEAEDAERARLRAERKRLEALPRTAGHWEGKRPTMTEGQHWDGLATTAARRAYLAGNADEFILYAAPAPGRTGNVVVDLWYLTDAHGEAV